MYRVSLKNCEDYQQEKVNAAILSGFEEIGGVNSRIAPGSRVLLKTNLLKKNKPEDAVTTNPAVLIGIINALKENGISDIVIADSPGGPFSVTYLRSIYKDAGINDVIEKTGVELNFNTDSFEDFNQDGVILKHMTLCSYLKGVDAVISCGKLKTHGMTGYTGAVKNLFGTVPGTTKVEYHYRYPKLPDFSNMLLDLALFIDPAFSVIDAVVGMEGDGPSAGTPRQVGALILSDSPVGADEIGVRLMNKQPKEICTLQRAIERGLISGEIEQDLQLSGDPLLPLIVKDYQEAHVAKVTLLSNKLPKSMVGFLERYFTPRPKVIGGKCIGCEVCAKSCPPKAIQMQNRLPVIDKNKCIKCFCCHELCPHKAMKIVRPRIAKYL